MLYNFFFNIEKVKYFESLILLYYIEILIKIDNFELKDYYYNLAVNYY